MWIAKARSVDRGDGGEPVKRFLPWIGVALLLLVRLTNWVDYPHLAGFDGYGHSAYLDHLLDEDELPDASRSWQTYHPPGYYMTGATAARVLGWTDLPDRYQAGKLVSALAGALAVLGLIPAARHLLGDKASWSCWFLAALPASIMVGAMVYNGSLAICMATLYLTLLVLLWDRPPTLASESALGLIAGLAVLVRTDAAALGAMLIFRAALALRRRGKAQALSILLGMVLSISIMGILDGWFFQRNLARFGHPVVANLDPDLYPYPHRSGLNFPGEIKTRLYLDPGGRIWSTPHTPVGVSSITASIYVSMWSDHTRSWSSRTHLNKGRLIAGVPLMLLALLGLWSVWGRKRWEPVLVMFGLNLATAYWLINKVPTYTGFKSFYLYPSFAITALFFGAGLSWCQERDSRLGMAMTALASCSLLFLGYSMWRG